MHQPDQPLVVERLSSQTGRRVEGQDVDDPCLEVDQHPLVDRSHRRRAGRGRGVVLPIRRTHKVPPLVSDETQPVLLLSLHAKLKDAEVE